MKHRLIVSLALTTSMVAVCATAAAQETQPRDANPQPTYDVPPTGTPSTTSTTSTTTTTDSVQTSPTTTTTTPPTNTTVGTTRTTYAEYNENASAERETKFRPNRPLLATGAALFVVPYVAGVIVGAQSDLEADKRNYIPVVGPWLDLGQRPCAFGSECSTGDNVGSAFLIGSGVAQGLGVILAATSLVVPERRTERVEVKSAAVHLVPMSFRAGGGVGALGTF